MEKGGFVYNKNNMDDVRVWADAVGRADLAESLLDAGFDDMVRASIGSSTDRLCLIRRSVQETVSLLEDQDLASLGVSDGNERARLLSQLPARPNVADPSASTSAGPTSGQGSVPSSDYADILRDLDAMIADLDHTVSLADILGFLLLTCSYAGCTGAVGGYGAGRGACRRACVPCTPFYCPALAQTKDVRTELDDGELDAVLLELCRIGLNDQRPPAKLSSAAAPPAPAPLRQTSPPPLPPGPPGPLDASAPEVTMRHADQTPSAVQNRLSAYTRRLRSGGNFSPAELDAMLQQEKVRVAMGKLAAAAAQAGTLLVYFGDVGHATTHEADNTTVHCVCMWRNHAAWASPFVCTGRTHRVRRRRGRQRAAGGPELGSL
jgi:hypothetical protein